MPGKGCLCFFQWVGRSRWPDGRIRYCGVVPALTAQEEGIQREIGRAVSRWSFFVPGIREDGSGKVPPHAAATAVDWAARLHGARSGRYWSTPKWVPFLHQLGCRVPPELLLPTDGQGWLEHEKYKRRGSA